MHNSTRIPARTAIVALLGIGALAALAFILWPRSGAPGPTPMLAVRSLPVPAADGAAIYALTPGAGGSVNLSWVETTGDVHSLNFSTLGSDGWSAPTEVASGSDWFVNWADRPRVVTLPDGALAAHWLVNVPDAEGSHYTYGIRVAMSDDGGTSWRVVHEPGMTNDADEYSGFLAYLAREGEGVIGAYLSPPEEGGEQTEYTGTEHGMTVRLADFRTDGSLASDVVLDGSVCSCCPLDIADAAAGPVIAYRNRTAEEIRDIWIVREVDGQWTDPAPVHDDGWEIGGCPVNGPAVAADGTSVAVAWFTGVGGVPEVRVALSDDGGATFGDALRVNDLDPMGYAGVASLGDGSFAVTWLEYAAEGPPVVKIRTVSPEGRLGMPSVVAVSDEGRAAGMPQLARAGSELVIAWRNGDRIESALLDLAGTQ